MKKHLTYSLLLLTSLLLAASCEEKGERVISQPVDWEVRVADLTKIDSLKSGSTYLATYSEIYSYNEDEYRSLTTTVSIRNISKEDSVFIEKIEYFNTHGVIVKSYIDAIIYLAPMETVEIVIPQLDTSGGTGANFVFDWYIYPNSQEPLFEAVMISNAGTQAFSFTTQGLSY